MNWQYKHHTSRLAGLGLIAAALTLPMVATSAQTRADTTGVIRAAILNYTKGGTTTARVGIESRTLKYTVDSATHMQMQRGDRRVGASKVEVGASRSAGVHQGVLETKGIRATASVATAVRECRPGRSGTVTGNVCGFRDFDTILALSDPVFSGSNAIVHLAGWNNTSMPGAAVTPEIMRYLLEFAGGVWSVQERRRLQGS